MSVDPKDVTYLGDVLKNIQQKLRQAGSAAQRVLPGSRGRIVMPLQEAATLVKSVSELAERSGMDKRLGFVKTRTGIQPVIDMPKTEDEGAVKEPHDGEAGANPQIGQ